MVNQTALEKKSLMLNNLEAYLLEEKMKMEIVEDYIKREYKQIQNERENLEMKNAKYKFLEFNEQKLNAEKESLVRDREKLQLE